MTDRKGLFVLAGMLLLLVLWRGGYLTPGVEGPPGNVVQLQTAEFDTFLKTGVQPVIVDFYADWCTPCRAVQPLLAQLSVDYAGRARFAKVDADRNGSLSDAHKVTGIPCVILFKEGQEVSRKVGAMSLREYDAWIAPHASSAPAPAPAAPSAPPSPPAAP